MSPARYAGRRKRHQCLSLALLLLLLPAPSSLGQHALVAAAATAALPDASARRSEAGVESQAAAHSSTWHDDGGNRDRGGASQERGDAAAAVVLRRGLHQIGTGTTPGVGAGILGSTVDQLGMMGTRSPPASGAGSNATNATRLPSSPPMGSLIIGISQVGIGLVRGGMPSAQERVAECGGNSRLRRLLMAPPRLSSLRVPSWRRGRPRRASSISGLSQP